MQSSASLRWLVVAVSAAMLLALAAACSAETIEVPGETVIVEKVVTETVEVPGQTVVKEVIKEVQVPGETVVVEKVVTETVEVPGQTVVVEKVVTETVEVPGETVTVEVVKEVQVPGQTIIVEKEVVKTVEVPGETVVVTKEVPVEVIKTVEIPVQITRTVEIPGPERIKTVEVPGKKYTTDPVTGRVFSAPEYGGMITFAKSNDYNERGVDLPNFGNRGMTSPMIEKLSAANWALDRSPVPLGRRRHDARICPDRRLGRELGVDRRPDPRVQDAPRRHMAQQGADERAGRDRRRRRVCISSDAWKQGGRDRVQRRRSSAGGA